MFNIIPVVIAGNKWICTDIHIVKLSVYYNNKTYDALLRTIAVVICNKCIGFFLFGDNSLLKLCLHPTLLVLVKNTAIVATCVDVSDQMSYDE